MLKYRDLQWKSVHRQNSEGSVGLAGFYLRFTLISVQYIHQGNFHISLMNSLHVPSFPQNQHRYDNESHSVESSTV